MVNIILSIILFIIIIICKIIMNIKYKTKERTALYNKSKKLTRALYILAIIIFIIEIIIVYFIDGLSNNMIIVPLTVSLIVIPFSISNLYNIIFNEDEKYIYIKNVVTKLKPTDVELKKYRRASIKLSDDKTLLGKDTTIEENKNLNDLYIKIMNSRRKNDLFISIIKYNFVIYVPLLILYILIPTVGFPFEFYTSFILLMKLYTMLTSYLLYKNLPYDDDYETRIPKPTNLFIAKQEILFVLIEIMSLSMLLCITYMYLYLIGFDIKIINTIYIIMFIYINIFYTLIHFSEKALYKNIFKALKNIRFIIYLIVSILLTIFVYYINIFDTIEYGLKNYGASILLAFIFTSVYELVKLARFTTVRGGKKHANNKKHKRSKSRNS